ncbi:NHLP-related RiPP peptide [Streptomyces sp. NPDC093111]|uniref:NHLP-related RiPP peptide n=1 Tax=Streptomyces sp. NPDC093111 TaxID=3154978 RepID=UPI0034306258
MRGEHALQYPRAQGQWRRPPAVEVAAGCPPRQQGVELVAFDAQQRHPVRRVAALAYVRGRRAQLAPQIGGGGHLVGFHTADTVETLPPCEPVRHRRGRPPMSGAQHVVALAVGGLAFVIGDHQAAVDQLGHQGRLLGVQRVGPSATPGLSRPSRRGDYGFHHLQTHTPGNEKLHLPAAVIDRLLDPLSTDDRFRDLFAHDRHAALVQAGCALSKEQLRTASPLSCLAVERLADKEAIAAAREELRAHLLADAAYSNPHAPEAGAMGAVLRRN